MLNHDRACVNGLHQDQYREALIFSLLFAYSRIDKEFKRKVIGKCEEMMHEDLTSRWVDSAYLRIGDFLITQKTLKSRISLFSDEKVTATEINGNSTTASVKVFFAGTHIYLVEE